jgi:hypothetical protein
MEEFEKVAQFTDGGGDYDWTEAGLYRDAKGHLWWSAQSGCSCNGYEEPRSLDDLVELTTLRQASAAYEEAFQCYHRTVTPWVDVVQQFRDAGL